ncbi:hypothetical protein [Clostridium brassicae]|uniref:Uncharacterized protein n=1 Tax=Clostridium brassicae TaxID=2999072 RepID=A0ABT4D971_9CLOT|nr:hypothetical protein [Clostridium brassicae]MCY6958858.1 hypothetical protein [Clostridium brassicae]
MNYICIVCDGKEVCIASKDTEESIQEFIVNNHSVRNTLIEDNSYEKPRMIFIDPAKVSLIMDITKEVNRMNERKIKS